MIENRLVAWIKIEIKEFFPNRSEDSSRGAKTSTNADTAHLSAFPPSRPYQSRSRSWNKKKSQYFRNFGPGATTKNKCWKVRVDTTWQEVSGQQRHTSTFHVQLIHFQEHAGCGGPNSQTTSSFAIDIWFVRIIENLNEGRGTYRNDFIGSSIYHLVELQNETRRHGTTTIVPCGRENLFVLAVDVHRRETHWSIVVLWKWKREKRPRNAHPPPTIDRLEWANIALWTDLAFVFEKGGKFIWGGGARDI